MQCSKKIYVYLNRVSNRIICCIVNKILWYLKNWIRDIGWSLRARFLGLPVFQVDTLLIPWKSILTSPPVWGIVAANFALDWAFYILLISMPIFLLDVMKTSITKVNMFRHKAVSIYNSTSYMYNRGSYSLATPPTVSPRKDNRWTGAKIPYWWRVTTLIWVVLLIGRSKFPSQHVQSKT